VEGARLATIDDLSRLEGLIADAHADLAKSRGGELWLRGVGVDTQPIDAIAADVRASADDGDRLVVVGTTEQVVVGFATAKIAALGDGGRLGVIDALYVEPEAREIGVGEAMMDLVVTWAREHGCEGIDATVMPGNREGKNFFERFGLVARAIVVHRRLSAGSDER
jgi:ribosomal protein S18 acetylase RimI-like enzyme